MAGLAGLEPTTLGLGNLCSIHLSYSPRQMILCAPAAVNESATFWNAPSQDRTAAARNSYSDPFLPWH